MFQKTVKTNSVAVCSVTNLEESPALSLENIILLRCDNEGSTFLYIVVISIRLHNFTGVITMYFENNLSRMCNKQLIYWQATLTEGYQTLVAASIPQGSIFCFCVVSVIRSVWAHGSF
jgi:hypothetical protein